jgi:uncharacterized protein
VSTDIQVVSSSLSIPLEGGRHTTAVWYAATTETAANLRVVLAHGAGAGQRHPFIAGIARRLAAKGIDTWTFNFPYMEARRRAPDKAAVLEGTFRSVIDVARRSTGQPRSLFAGGKSMGGRIATHLAAQGDALAGVFALGYPLHPPGKPDQLRSAHLGGIAVPILITQGEFDPFGTPSELTPVIATMRSRVTLEVVPGGDHSLAVRGQPSDRLYDRLAALIVDWATGVASQRRGR